MLNVVLLIQASPATVIIGVDGPAVMDEVMTLELIAVAVYLPFVAL